jgi:Holliday junction resolvase RusA-like endonuclease
MTETRTWTLTVHGPAPMYSVNTREHWRKTSAARKEWREATYLLAKQAKLPKLLGRVRIDITLHFTDSRPRDTANFHPTVGKPCTDALAGGRIVRQKNGVMRTEVGYELIADDTPRHLDGPHLQIGGPVSKKDHPYGLAVITITDLSEGTQ